MGVEKRIILRDCKKRVYYKKVVYDGGEFSVGDDVYVKRREDASSDYEDPEVKECKVPEGDWICEYCEAKRVGKIVEMPSPPKGNRRVRTAKEKLLDSDLWAARIESGW